MAATITDVLIILLLLGGIGYGWIISKRVQILMGALEELEPLVREFSAAVDKSEASVHQLRRNLDEGTQEPEAPAAVPPQPEEDDEPMFASRRFPPRKMPGVQVVRDKQDLVKRFFEATRS